MYPINKYFIITYLETCSEMCQAHTNQISAAKLVDSSILIKLPVLNIKRSIVHLLRYHTDEI